MFYCDGEEYIHLDAEDKKMRSGYILDTKYVAAVEKKRRGMGRRWGYSVWSASAMHPTSSPACLQATPLRPTPSHETIDLANAEPVSPSMSAATSSSTTTRKPKRRKPSIVPPRRRKPPLHPSAGNSPRRLHPTLRHHLTTATTAVPPIMTATSTMSTYVPGDDIAQSDSDDAASDDEDSDNDGEDEASDCNASDSICMFWCFFSHPLVRKRYELSSHSSAFVLSRGASFCAK